MNGEGGKSEVKGRKEAAEVVLVSQAGGSGVGINNIADVEINRPLEETGKSAESGGERC